MKKQIALLVAIAGLATISAQGQGYCTGVIEVEYFNNSSWEQAGDTEMFTLNVGTVCSMPDFPATSADLSLTTIPEPSTLAYCAIGLAGLTVARRSFRQCRS